MTQMKYPDYEAPIFFSKSEIIDDKKVGAQELMFRDAKSKQNNFFIACDNTYSKGGITSEGSKIKVVTVKKYTSFIDIDNFLKYEKTLSDNSKNLYEMLSNELVEIYDIDGDYTKSSFLNNDGSKISYDTIVNDFIDARLDFQDEYYKNIPLVRNNFIIKKTDDPCNIGTPKEKISLHIIIRNNTKFENNDELKKFTNKFKKYTTTFYPKLIFDRSIYSKNRCIRILGHSKAGQTGRKSYRYPEFSTFNDICCRKLFFASYLEGTELFYPKIDDNNESLIDIKNDTIEYSNDSTNIDNLIDLILESINNETLSICDTEIKNKLNYKNWSNLVFSILNTIQTESPKTIRNIFNKLFTYYRHYYTIDCDETWSNMYNFIGTYKNLNITYLHYFAKQNDRYYDLFPEYDFQNISKIPEKNRTKDQQNIYNKIIRYITNKNLDKLTKTTLIKPIIRTDNWVTSDIFLESTKKIDIIKAGLGRGKSQSVSDYLKKSIPDLINQSSWDNIIVLTPRRSYAKSAKERLVRETTLAFICYLEQKKSHIDSKYVVIQAESLYRLQINIGNTLVIIDEVEAFLSQLTSTQTHGDNHVRNIETFMELVKNSNKVIALDAFISNRTLKTFITLSGINHINFFEFTQQLKQRKAVEINNIDMFIESLLSDLEKGKKIFLFSSSNTKLLKTVRKTYVSDKKEDKIITALLPAIREKYPNKNIIEFHSKYMTIQLTNVNTDWKEADLVACTSTITVGCNFDTPNVFNKVYLYANASSRNLVRDMFQASWRVRHLIDDEMVYCLDTNHYGMNLTTNIKEIESNMEKKNELLLSLSLKHNLKFPHQTPEIIKDLFCFNKLESNMSIMSLKPLFERYLNICNYKKEEIDMDSILEVEFDEFIEYDIEYNDIPEITPSKCKELIFKKKTTPLLELESLQLEKFHFQYQLLNRSKDIEEGLWKIYKNFGKGKFRNISIEKGFQEGTCTIQDIIEKESYSHLNSGLSLRFEIIKEITQWIGMKDTSEYGFSLNKEKLDNIIELFENNREKIHLAFDMRDGTKGELNCKTTIALINKILDRWSFSALKSTQKKQKVKGKVIDNSEYIIQGKGNSGFDIAKEIKPYKKSNFFEEKHHPLLLHKDDKKIITEEELENIRLNRYN